MITITALLTLFLITPNVTPANVDIGWRVVGGETADPGQFPFTVSLRTSQDRHTCGGSIISEKNCITAAHCVKGLLPKNLIVVAGTNELNKGGVRMAVKNIIVHPEYNPSASTNDVAILELEKPIIQTNLVQIIPLGCKYIDGAQNCTLIGWGRTSSSSPVPNYLQYLESKTEKHNECKDKWSPLASVVDSQICTLTKAGEGACYGDSGGPLVVEHEGLIGLVSWGSPCARGMPDVYTRVSSFCAWINKHIQN